jgi:tetratricopeptide (TPR) repeat protein
VRSWRAVEWTYVKFVAGFFLIASTLASAAPSLDDEINDFVKAVEASPTAPRPPLTNASSIHRLLHDQDNLPMLETAVRELMAESPSPRVEVTGTELMQELARRETARQQHYSEAVTAILTKAKGILIRAKNPADLDALLTEVRLLATPESQWSYTDSSTMTLTQKINALQQFVLSWQNYLSASASGRSDESRQALDRILENTQLDSLGFFPRSEILARRDGPPLSEDPVPAPGAPGKSAMDQINDLLGKVRTLDDVFTALNQINAIPTRPIDLSDISTLQKQRVDAEAGLPVTLDLKAAVSGKSYGDDISRIENMELMALLPFYLETGKSNPPKAGEKVDSYLGRVAEEANAEDNLALLQRALAAQKGLADAENPSNPPGIDSVTQFLAGLSQEAAGEYAQAVTTYEKALGTYEPLLPVKVVGDRLAAIKAAHPDEFAKGLSDFTNPVTAPGYQPGFPPGFRPGWPPGYPGYPSQVVNELPIPLVISIPAHDAHSAPSPARH